MVRGLLLLVLAALSGACHYRYTPLPDGGTHVWACEYSPYLVDGEMCVPVGTIHGGRR